MEVLFISENYLKENTNLSSNIDVKLLKPSIIKAQDLFIENFIGKTITLELKNGIINNNLTNIQKDLLNLIKKAQAEFTCFLAYPDLMFRFMNKAITNPNVENGSNINKEDLIYIRDISRNQGEFYLNIVKTFLKDNKTYFPSFSENCTEKQAFKFPIEFDDYSKKSTDYFKF